MTKENYTAEGAGGGGNGTAFTAANSDTGGSGLALAASIDATGAPVTYDSTRAKGGTYSLKFNRVSGSTASYVQRTLVDGAVARGKARDWFYFPSNPTADINIMKFMSSTASSAGVGSIFVTTAGKIKINNTAGTTIYTSTASVPLNAWFMVDAASAPGTTTTTGAMDLAFYNAAGTKLEEYNGTGLNLGTVNNVQYVRVGRSGDTWIGAFWVDDLATDSGSGYIGPEGSVPPNAIVVYTDNVIVADLRTSTSGGGGALTYSVALASGQSVTYTEPVDGVFLFVKKPTGGPSVYTGTASETGGTTDTVTINVPQLVEGTQVAYSPRFLLSGVGGPWE